jgi:hypothetical protein
MHLDSNAEQLTVEDPQFIYFIRNIPWRQFAHEVGFMAVDFPHKYDFALSFAGEDRSIAESLFNRLVEYQVEVFYDRNEQHRIVASDVEEYLKPIYQSEARFVVVLLSPNYPRKVWTKFESEQFKSRFADSAVIPVWFADAPPGMFDTSRTVGGVTLDRATDIPAQLTELVNTLVKKLREDRGSLL